MKPKKRQKMCYHCEGEVDIDVIVCPFCAADLRVEKPEQVRPPLTPRFTPSPSIQPEIEALPAEEAEGEKSIWLPTLLFALGMQLSLFGLLLLFFSRDGVLHLHWDGALWFLYLFASIPFLIFGYRSLSKL